jgi:hypothetical protein
VVGVPVVVVSVVSWAEQGEVVELGLAAMLDGDDVVCFELARGGAAGVRPTGTPRDHRR